MMTEAEIIKALECCSKVVDEGCDECPLKDVNCYQANIEKEAIALINRKNAEIEQFADIGKLYSEIKAEARAEAIKEFVERVKKAPIKCGLPLLGLTTKDEIEEYFNGIMLQVRDAIDQIAKEMGVE